MGIGGARVVLTSPVLAEAPRQKRALAVRAEYLTAMRKKGRLAPGRGRRGGPRPGASIACRRTVHNAQDTKTLQVNKSQNLTFCTSAPNDRRDCR